MSRPVRGADVLDMAQEMIRRAETMDELRQAQAGPESEEGRSCAQECPAFVALCVFELIFSTSLAWRKLRALSSEYRWLSRPHRLSLR